MKPIRRLPHPQPSLFTFGFDELGNIFTGMISGKSKTKVRIVVLCLSMMYATFAVFDDSHWLEGSGLSLNYVDRGINVEPQDDATPWLTFNISHHRNFRAMAKVVTDGHSFISYRGTTFFQPSKWPSGNTLVIPSPDLSALICTFRI